VGVAFREVFKEDRAFTNYFFILILAEDWKVMKKEIKKISISFSHNFYFFTINAILYFFS